jgi:hypothetical protein
MNCKNIHCNRRIKKGKDFTMLTFDKNTLMVKTHLCDFCEKILVSKFNCTVEKYTLEEFKKGQNNDTT